MNKLYSFIPKKTLLLIILLLGAIVVLGLILFVRQSKKATLLPAPVISQSPPTLSSLQKSAIGKTTLDEVEKSHQITDKQVLANGDIEYSINSKVETRPDQIVFHNKLAQFERTVIVGNPTMSDTLKLSDQISRYGPAERIIKGSKFYGSHMDTYIYAAKGFTFIANTNANEIYEIQTFTPTSFENYLSNYGKDIKEYEEIKE